MMFISALVGSSRNIVSWWSRDPADIVRKDLSAISNSEFTWKTARGRGETRARTQLERPRTHSGQLRAIL